MTKKGGAAWAASPESSKDPHHYYSVKGIPDDSDKRSTWYEAGFVCDLSKLIRGRLKGLIQSLSVPKLPVSPEVLPERDFPYEEWKILTDGVRDLEPAPSATSAMLHVSLAPRPLGRSLDRSTKNITTMAINGTSISWSATAPPQSRRSTRKPNTHPEAAPAPNTLVI